MANTNPQVNQSSQELVAILDSETYEVLFDPNGPMSCSVREESHITQFAVEDGTTRSDHRVILPREISIPLVLTDDFRNVYEQIKTRFNSLTSLIVQTKVSSYPNMFILSMNHEETAERADGISVDLMLREITTVTPEYGSLPARKVTATDGSNTKGNDKKSDTVQSGSQRTTTTNTPTKTKSSTLYNITLG
jgi:hypothetical protein